MGGGPTPRSSASLRLGPPHKGEGSFAARAISSWWEMNWLSARIAAPSPSKTGRPCALKGAATTSWGATITTGLPVAAAKAAVSRPKAATS